ncbi:major histocompatibility complex class I-related gene protein-like [Poecilia formosa]|uniref:Major histocompatibility complex class I-related gene protein-like n=1 Tax=Poecilia formosa TaxID=48698 RepID=A0A087XKF3_POEFO|nr:PREDICTED: major histocompatibility complex class I-related gene protein-like [Poecilia formosa]
MKIFALFFICHVVSPAQHLISSIIFAISGAPDVPEFVTVGILDDIPVGYCDSNKIQLEPRTTWMKNVFRDYPNHQSWLSEKCKKNNIEFISTVRSLMERFNQSEGVHIFQRTIGCSWDDNSETISAFVQFGYDGEDLISFDLGTLTWIAPIPHTVITKLNWDTNGQEKFFWTNTFKDDCRHLFNLYLGYGNSSLQTPVLPSLFLLQKTPTSPVSCHATGFYPNKAVIFWSRDGEKIHENVDPFESLPNNDGTFQMTVNLNILSLTSEDWSRINCIFQFSNFQENISFALDKAIIKTNYVSAGGFLGIFVVPATGASFLLLAVCVFQTKIRKWLYERQQTT